MEHPIYILGIESSCDDTSAAVICDGKVLSNVIANQEVHAQYGGVVPELASRAHQQNIVPVVQQALNQANISKNQLSAVAFTNGPGLMGSLLVGTSFAKSLALGLTIPLIDVNHMQAHILAHLDRKSVV
jgi:N6-L-threonylcarbamoyladenine synthase